MGRKTKNSSDGEQDLSSLSEDGRLIVTILERKIENILKFVSEEIKKRDDRIEKMEKGVLGLRRNVCVSIGGKGGRCGSLRVTGCCCHIW